MLIITRHSLLTFWQNSPRIGNNFHRNDYHKFVGVIITTLFSLAVWDPSSTTDADCKANHKLCNHHGSSKHSGHKKH